MALFDPYQCFNASQCAGEYITTGQAEFHSFGYKSASGRPILIDCWSTAKCSGSFSCYDVPTFGAFELNCLGSSACSNSADIYSMSVLCAGSNSCTHSTMFISGGMDSTLLCSGYKSCAHSHISGDKIIEASGAYALYNTTIDRGDTNITLGGYHAGLNAKILCNDTCIINCFGNSCDNMYINCDGECTINVQSNDTLFPLSNITDIIHWIDLEYEPYESASNNNEACDEAAAITYDDYKGYLNGDNMIINTNQSLCCRSSEACRSTTIMRINEDKQRIVCSGYDSCGTDLNEHNITNNGDIYCEEQHSCRSSTLFTWDSVYCLAQESCSYFTTIYNALNIFCSAYLSCAQSTIITAGLGYIYNVYYIGVEAGINANYHCAFNDKCILFCGARNACYNLTVSCNGICTVYCDRDSLCPNGYPLNIKSVTANSTNIPSFAPTNISSSNTTIIPSSNPTNTTSLNPTNIPSSNAINITSSNPVSTKYPSTTPSIIPSSNPTLLPSNNPTDAVTSYSFNTTIFPSIDRSLFPTTNPVYSPSAFPSLHPISETRLLSEAPSNDYKDAEVELLSTHAMNNTVILRKQSDSGALLVPLIVSIVSIIGLVILCYIMWSRKKNEARQHMNENVENINKENEIDDGDADKSVNNLKPDANPCNDIELATKKADPPLAIVTVNRVKTTGATLTAHRPQPVIGESYSDEGVRQNVEEIENQTEGKKPDDTGHSV